jgi:hypothetical protein
VLGRFNAHFGNDFIVAHPERSGCCLEVGLRRVVTSMLSQCMELELNKMQ